MTVPELVQRIVDEQLSACAFSQNTGLSQKGNELYLEYVRGDEYWWNRNPEDVAKRKAEVHEEASYQYALLNAGELEHAGPNTKKRALKRLINHSAPMPKPIEEEEEDEVVEIFVPEIPLCDEGYKVCPECDGDGIVNCPKCKGSGCVKEHKRRWWRRR